MVSVVAELRRAGPTPARGARRARDASAERRGPRRARIHPSRDRGSAAALSAHVDHGPNDGRRAGHWRLLDSGERHGAAEPLRHAPGSTLLGRPGAVRSGAVPARTFDAPTLRVLSV